MLLDDLWGVALRTVYLRVMGGLGDRGPQRNPRRHLGGPRSRLVTHTGLRAGSWRQIRGQGAVLQAVVVEDGAGDAVGRLGGDARCQG